MLNSHKNKIIATLTLVAFLSVGLFAFREAPAPKRPGPKNLKILPKNIDHAALINIMHGYCQALGYECGSCHAAAADGKGLDFASDAKPEKEAARHMMKMVMKLNKKFFKVKGSFADNFVNAKYEVSCYTCHHGSEHPAMEAPVSKEHRMPPPPPPPAPAN